MWPAVSLGSSGRLHSRDVLAQSLPEGGAVVDKRDGHGAAGAERLKALSFGGEHQGPRTGHPLDDPSLAVTSSHQNDGGNGPAGQEAGFYRHIGVYEALLPHQASGGVNI